jgi:hypothetical protein
MAWVTEQRCPRCLDPIGSFASIMLTGNEPWLERAAPDPYETFYECPHCRVVWKLIREGTRKQQPHYVAIHMLGPDRLERLPGIKLCPFRMKRIRPGRGKYRSSKRWVIAANARAPAQSGLQGPNRRVRMES